MLQHLATLNFQRGVQHLRSHKRVAITIATNPRAHRQHLAQWVLIHGQKVVRAGQIQEALQLAVHLRHLRKKSGVEIGQRIVDLVNHTQFVSAQQTGLKQALHGRFQFIPPGVGLFTRELNFIAVADQRDDALLCIQHTFALHLGGVRGKHWHRFGLFQACKHCITIHTHAFQLGNGVIQAGLARGHTRQFMLAIASNQMAVFSNIAQHRKNRERAYQ